jgi:alpha-galactosidase
MCSEGLLPNVKFRRISINAMLAIVLGAASLFAWPSTNRTPPMGFNSWNLLLSGYTSDSINVTLYKNVADSFVTMGFRGAGYNRLMVSGGMLGMERDASGGITWNSKKVPSGIRELTKYIHDRGLLAEVYSDAGNLNCWGSPGCYGHWQQDADSFATWEFDGVKEDWCGGSNQSLTPRVEYPKLTQALKNTGKEFYLEICCWGQDNPWEWGANAGTFWRNGPDISADWTSIMEEINDNQHAQAAGPGKGWNFPDMLQAGFLANETEDKAHFAMWCIMASPLIVSFDPKQLSKTTKDMLLNPEAIAVDQDSAGIQGVEVAPRVWSKPLAAPNSRAVVLFNSGESALTIKAKWSQIGLAAGPATVRDIWQRKDLGVFSDSFSAQVPGHGCAFLKIVSGTTKAGAPAVSGRRPGPTPKTAIVCRAGFASGPEAALKGFALYDVTGKRVFGSEQRPKDGPGAGTMGVYIAQYPARR